jgi:hypothetical protein
LSGFLVCYSFKNTNDKDAAMSNEEIAQRIEEEAEALAEKILMLYVVDGMEAKEKVKQLLLQFAAKSCPAIH